MGNKLQFSIKKPSFRYHYEKMVIFERRFSEKRAFFEVIIFVLVIVATVAGYSKRAVH
jgi:hypothetical protein